MRVWVCWMVRTRWRTSFGVLGCVRGWMGRALRRVFVRHRSDADAKAGIARQHAGIERCLTIRGKEGVFGMAAHPGVAGGRRLLGVDGDDGVEWKKQKQKHRRPCTHGQKSAMAAWRCSLQLRAFGDLEEGGEVVRFPASAAPDVSHGDGFVFFRRRPWR